MTDIIEKVSINDSCNVTQEQSREIIENRSKVGGYVTITINKGLDNERIIQKDKPNLLTIDGRDFFHAQVYTNTSVGTKGGNAIALSDNAVNPVATDTALLGEITTGGLTRVQASSIVHTDDTNITTLENVFTATAAFTNIHKSGLFNLDTIGGIMTHASEFSADVDLQIGDTITVTWTLTLG